MGKVYGEAKVCLDGNENGEQCYNLEPELTDIMAESHNFTLHKGPKISKSLTQKVHGIWHTGK